MTLLTKAELITEARIIYRGIAADMGEFDLCDAAGYVADQMYDTIGAAGCTYDYYEIAIEALKDYF